MLSSPNYFIEVINYLTVTTIILVYCSLFYRKIPQIAFYLLILNLAPFFINYLLFDPEYMSDQFGYLDITKSLRSGMFKGEYSFSLIVAGYIFSIVPVPIISSVLSIGFVNRLIFSLYFLELNRKYAYLRKSLLLVITIPSLVLYSSLALRDTIILIAMVQIVLIFRNGRYLEVFLVMLLLVVLKPQNALLMLLFLFIFRFGKGAISSVKYLVIFVVFLVSITSFTIDSWLDYLNLIRNAMWAENGGIDILEPIMGLADMLIIVPSSVVNFFLKPNIGEVDSLLTILQFLENIVLYGWLFIISKKLLKVSPLKFWPWALFILISSSVYGLIVANAGTISRYRYPFLIIFLLGMLNELKYRDKCAV